MVRSRNDSARLAALSAIAASLAAPAALSAPAMAQAVPPPIPGVPSGVPTRDELEGIREQPDRQPPRLEIAGGVERAPCPLADPQFADVPVTITDVTFNNLKGATPAELAPAWRPFAGKPQPIAVICEIRDAAATILRNKGYLAAVQVPTQHIEGGVVRLEVLYARVSAIRARGETLGAERKLQEYLGQLTRDEIFDRNRAERYLLLARDLPGYNVQLTLKPAGTAPGDLVGEVTVLRRPYAFDFTVQNYAAKATGRWGGQLRAQAFGVTGLGDATSVAFYSTADIDEQNILQASHEFRPGSEGLVIEGRFAYAWTRPDVDLSNGSLFNRTEIRAETLFASLSARYPLRRSQAMNYWLGAGFDYVDQEVDLIRPDAVLARDRLSIAWLRAEYDAVDLSSPRPEWRTGGSLEVRRGLPVFDAARNCGTVACAVPGDPRATVIRAAMEGELAFGEFALVGAPRAQYAFEPVASFEKFTAGNYTVGRGYDPGTLTGDSGVGATVELRGPRLKPFEQFEARFQPYVFGDAAWVWNHQDGLDSDRLVSVGGGIRAELGDRFRFDATLAVPTERAGDQTKRGDPRLLVTLTTRLLPWRNN